MVHRANKIDSTEYCEWDRVYGPGSTVDTEAGVALKVSINRPKIPEGQILRYLGTDGTDLKPGE